MTKTICHGSFEKIIGLTINFYYLEGKGRGYHKRELKSSRHVVDSANLNLFLIDIASLTKATKTISFINAATLHNKLVSKTTHTRVKYFRSREIDFSTGVHALESCFSSTCHYANEKRSPSWHRIKQFKKSNLGKTDSEIYAAETQPQNIYY